MKQVNKWSKCSGNVSLASSTWEMEGKGYYTIPLKNSCLWICKKAKGEILDLLNDCWLGFFGRKGYHLVQLFVDASFTTNPLHQASASHCQSGQNRDDIILQMTVSLPVKN